MNFDLLQVLYKYSDIDTKLKLYKIFGLTAKVKIELVDFEPKQIDKYELMNTWKGSLVYRIGLGCPCCRGFTYEIRYYTIGVLPKKPKLDRSNFEVTHRKYCTEDDHEGEECIGAKSYYLLDGLWEDPYPNDDIYFDYPEMGTSDDEFSDYDE